jgi:hypothetical protein
MRWASADDDRSSATMSRSRASRMGMAGANSSVVGPGLKTVLLGEFPPDIAPCKESDN